MIIAIACLFMGVILLILGLTIERLLLAFSISCILSSCVYIIMRKKWIIASQIKTIDLRKSQINLTFLYLFNTLFFMVFCYSLYALHDSIYYRPIGYFSAIIVMSTIISISILFSALNTKVVSLILLQIIIVGLSLRGSVYYMFPGYVGIDPWFHAWFIDQLLSIGHITNTYPIQISSLEQYYVNFPVLHILCGITSLLSNLNIKNSLFLSAGLFEVISLLFIYLIGKKFFGPEIGLLALLLSSVLNYHILWGFWIIPMTIGIGMVIFVFYMHLRRPKCMNQSNEFLILIFLVSAAIILTHPLSSLILFFLLITTYMSAKIQARIYTVGENKNESRSEIISIKSLLSLLTVMLGYWIYATRLFETHISKSIANLFQMDIFIAKSVYKSFLAELLDISGLIVLSTISLIGYLYILNRDTEYKESFIICTSAWLCSIFVFIGNIFNINAFFMDRWVPFIGVILSLPASLGLKLLCCKIDNQPLSAIVVVLITAIVLISTLSYSGLHPDGSFNDINSHNVRKGLFYSELRAVETMSEKYGGTIGTDVYLTRPFILKNIKSITITYNLINRCYVDIPANMIIIRRYIVDNPFYHADSNFRGVSKLEHNVIADLDAIKFNKVYDCGTSYVYKNDSD